jgi:CheY-like chemotaxis protein
MRLAGIRILVVDDSDINLDVTRCILELSGATVTLAGNGSEALDRLRAGPTDYDLVLMDVQMPVLDGHAATRTIRETLGLVDLPIIALTAGALGSERQRSAASGMDDYIVKPFDADTLVGSILRHVQSGRAHSSDSSAKSLGHETQDGWPLLHGIDREQARSRLLGDLSLFMSSLRRLLAEYADLEAPLGTLQTPMNLVTAQRMHKLKGTASMMGANGIEQLARRAEQAIKSANLADASTICSQLGIEIQRLRESAAKVLAADTVGNAGPMSQNMGVEMTCDVLDRLMNMMRAQDLGAVDLFNSMATDLRRHLGRQAFETVQDLVDRLMLPEAADALAKRRS